MLRAGCLLLESSHKEQCVTEQRRVMNDECLLISCGSCRLCCRCYYCTEDHSNDTGIMSLSVRLSSLAVVRCARTHDEHPLTTRQSRSDERFVQTHFTSQYPVENVSSPPETELKNMSLRSCPDPRIHQRQTKDNASKAHNLGTPLDAISHQPCGVQPKFTTSTLSVSPPYPPTAHLKP